ncbi:MAG: RHS repeat protein [Nitrospirae bacterium]|nr:RHS repeat protein [Nitrospirota bacterium]MBI3378317.1 RHS repeat protein [Nitrospirota bacterium]
MRNLSTQSKYLILRYLLIRRIILFLALYEYLKRLTEATSPWGSINYAYDPVGNRANTTADASNRLLENAIYTYAYDNNGNLITKTKKATGEITRYYWDYENRLVRAAANFLSRLRFWKKVKTVLFFMQKPLCFCLSFLPHPPHEALPLRCLIHLCLPQGKYALNH